MATKAKERKGSNRNQPPLDKRFTFLGDGAPATDRKALRSTLYPVLDKVSGFERNLKLWRKTGSAVDDDLRELWLHEMRQVQRVMSYAGAREVIVDILEFVEDAEEFGVVLEHVGQSLTTKLLRVSRQHWLKNLAAPRSRTLFWKNIRRLVDALGIVHAQGLVHGHISTDSVMTEASEEPDFQLTGFEWSLWLTADKGDRAQAKLKSAGQAARAERYSFAEDWKALGRVIAQCLDATVRATGEVQPLSKTETPIALGTSERLLLKKLVAPTRLDNLDALSIGKSIDDIVTDVARTGSSRAGTFILVFDQKAKLADAVYEATNGEIPTDDYPAQLDWVRADLDSNPVLLVPRDFDAERSHLTLVTANMVYGLGPLRDDGVPLWDIAVCRAIETRKDKLHIGDSDEHDLVQPIRVATGVRDARETKSRIGPDVLDWSVFAGINRASRKPDRTERVRQALVLIQVIEAVVKALEVYPIEILRTERDGGRRYVLLRADPNNERDNIARKLRLTDTAAALKRLFEDEHRDADAKWRLSQSAIRKRRTSC